MQQWKAARAVLSVNKNTTSNGDTAASVGSDSDSNSDIGDDQSGKSGSSGVGSIDSDTQYTQLPRLFIRSANSSQLNLNHGRLTFPQPRLNTVLSIAIWRACARLQGLVPVTVSGGGVLTVACQHRQQRRHCATDSIGGSPTVSWNGVGVVERGIQRKHRAEHVESNVMDDDNREEERHTETKRRLSTGSSATEGRWDVNTLAVQGQLTCIEATCVQNFNADVSSARNSGSVSTFTPLCSCCESLGYVPLTTTLTSLASACQDRTSIECHNNEEASEPTNHAYMSATTSSDLISFADLTVTQRACNTPANETAPQAPTLSDAQSHTQSLSSSRWSRLHSRFTRAHCTEAGTSPESDDDEDCPWTATAAMAAVVAGDTLSQLRAERARWRCHEARRRGHTGRRGTNANARVDDDHDDGDGNGDGDISSDCDSMFANSDDTSDDDMTLTLFATHYTQAGH